MWFRRSLDPAQALYQTFAKTWTGQSMSGTVTMRCFACIAFADIVRDGREYVGQLSATRFLPPTLESIDSCDRTNEVCWTTPKYSDEATARAQLFESVRRSRLFRAGPFIYLNEPYPRDPNGCFYSAIVNHPDDLYADLAVGMSPQLAFNPDASYFENVIVDTQPTEAENAPRDTQPIYVENAIVDGNIAAIKQLVTEREDAGWMDALGRTPLHCAAHFGREDAVEWLLQRGAPLDATDAYGDTPLHRSYARHWPRIVEILIRHGADEQRSNKRGRRPRDLEVGTGEAC